MSSRVDEILSWYESDNPGVLANLRRMMMTGTLAGTGKFVILPVDQGFEHGPARSFAKNPAGYDPHYHFSLALDSGCTAYAAPLGFLAAGGRTYAGKSPSIRQLRAAWLRRAPLQSGQRCIERYGATIFCVRSPSVLISRLM